MHIDFRLICDQIFKLMQDLKISLRSLRRRRWEYQYSWRQVRKILESDQPVDYVPLSLEFSTRCSIAPCRGSQRERTPGGGASCIITEPGKQIRREGFGLKD